MFYAAPDQPRAWREEWSQHGSWSVRKVHCWRHENREMCVLLWVCCPFVFLIIFFRDGVYNKFLS